jgi:hypothetical protein
VVFKEVCAARESRHGIVGELGKRLFEKISLEIDVGQGCVLLKGEVPTLSTDTQIVNTAQAGPWNAVQF